MSEDQAARASGALPERRSEEKPRRRRATRAATGGRDDDSPAKGSAALPKDERPESWGESAGYSDDWYLSERPPHH